MTSVEQAVAPAGLNVGRSELWSDDSTWLKIYRYSRAQSIMGDTSHIERNTFASRILGLPGA